MMLKRKEARGRGWGGHRPNQNGRPHKHGEATTRKSFRIPTSLDKTLKDLAGDRNISQSDLVVQALIEWVAT